MDESAGKIVHQVPHQL